MPEDPVADLCELLGEDAIRAVVARFYATIPSDPLLGPMYPKHDLAGAEQRLADFLAMRFGGSRRYAETRGHPRLRMRHAPFALDRAARDRWMELMNAAIDAGDLAEEPRERMRGFLADVATFLVNR